MKTDERRRELSFKAIGQVKGWEEALKIRYAFWRRTAVENKADPYLVGRADSWEEIIELIHNASHAIQEPSST